MIIRSGHGISPVLDAGQCNHFRSLTVIVLKPKRVVGLSDINELRIHCHFARETSRP